MFAFLVVALLATLGVAIVGWFRPLPYKPPPAPTYSEKQVADAKAKVCAAYEKVRKAGDVAGARNGGSDPTAMLAVATNSRQVLEVGSRYLSTKVAELPATPPDLVVAIRRLASIYDELVIDYLADATDSVLDPLVHAGNEAHSTIQGLCK